MTDHTNAPWKSEGSDQFGDYNIVNGEANLAIAAVVSNLRPAAEVAANAAFIVKAVNSHDALVKALENAKAALEACSDLFSEIRGDWTDPRSECREGQDVIHKASVEIDAALSRPAHGGWEDISTAPPAGTRIDVWAVSAAGYGMRWPNVIWGPNNGCWLGAPLTKEDQIRWTVTHWMPVPAGPISRNHGQGGGPR